MLVLQCKTQLHGKTITMRYRSAENMWQAISAFTQHVKTHENVNLLELKLPLEIKLVSCND
jgi:hypothetical protein